MSSFTAPTGVIAAIYVFAILQIIGCYQIFCRPTFGFAYNHMIRYSTLIKYLPSSLIAYYTCMWSSLTVIFDRDCRMSWCLCTFAMKGISFPVLQHSQDAFPNIDVEVRASFKCTTVVTKLQQGMPDLQATGVIMLCGGMQAA